MLFKILIIVPIISMCVDGTASDHEPKHAVSTQSYHRGDVPLSYKFTSVHIYTTPRPEQKPAYHQHTNNQGNLKLNTIQYAPLNQNSHQNNEHRHNPGQIYEYKHAENVEKQFQYSTEENGKEHLEPRVEAENLEVHNQNYRSFVPGHNIEVLQANRALGQNDIYKAYHHNLQNQKVKIQKFANPQGRQQELHIQHKPESFGTAEQMPLSEEHNILYTFLPRPTINTQYNPRAERPHTLNQALSAKIPRLHLNIARVYGIAHLPQQAPVTQISHKKPNNGKPPSHTQAIFLPLNAQIHQKTILYPVQDTNKNYPIHT